MSESSSRYWIDKRSESFYVDADGEILGTVKPSGTWGDRYYYASSFKGARSLHDSYITLEFAKRAIERHVAGGAA